MKIRFSLNVLMPFREATPVIFLLILVGCAVQPESVSAPIYKATSTLPNPSVHTPVFPTLTLAPDLIPPSPFICDENWQALPVIPEVAEDARMLYQQGLSQGNDLHAFSKIGDGEISTDWFLTAFDLGEEYYDLGAYQNLKTVIEAFQGSFERRSLAAQRGFNTKLIMDVSASDPALCNADESPLDCELRIHNPSITVLSLGTNQVHRPEEFESGMRRILNILLAKNVLPILSPFVERMGRTFLARRIFKILHIPDSNSSGR